MVADSQREIIALYQRFCQLDRTGKGFISADEFMGVPEFAVNPLCQVQTINFSMSAVTFVSLIMCVKARLFMVVSMEG